MIEFLTLFLGLVVGPQTVQVAVDGPVVRVELRLDGVPCGVLEPPAWEGRCDLGPELVPHELVAVARGEDGTVLDREVQWINLARPPAEARWILERDAEGIARRATLAWESVTREIPTAFVTLDGEALYAGEPRPVEAAELAAGADTAAREDARLRVLEAELLFSFGIEARAVATFGGSYGEDLDTDLTAVPVVAAEPPSTALLAEALRVAGEPVEVQAVESEGSDLIVVRQAGFDPPLIRPRQYQALPRALAAGDWVEFLVPRLQVRTLTERGEIALFPTAGWRESDTHASHWLTWRFATEDLLPEAPRLADAVAVAGSTVAARNRRRAVLLVLDGPGADPSFHRPDAVRRYLETLRVPLVVWDVRPRGADAPVPAGWGEAERVLTRGDLLRALGRLEDLLEAQTVVWIEGRHRPQAVELTAAARRAGLDLAGVISAPKPAPEPAPPEPPGRR